MMNSSNFLMLVCGLLLFATCLPSGKRELTIATAANMQFAMEGLTKEFTKQTNIKCDLIISSSGKLMAQIREGAPYDVFVSADMKYPQILCKEGLTRQGPGIYAKGKLVLWSVVDDITPSLKVLSNDQIEHIALPNPKTAPYGVAAVEVLNHYQLFDSLENKFVYGESIAQTNQFITSKSAEVGFTAMSVVLSPEMKVKGKWIEIDPSLYSPIDQGIVVVNRKDVDNENADKFYRFIFSKDAKKVLKEFGYLVNE